MQSHDQNSQEKVPDFEECQVAAVVNAIAPHGASVSVS